MRRLIESGYKISISLACIFTPTWCCAGCASTTDAQLISYGAHTAFEILNWLIIFYIKQALITAVTIITSKKPRKVMFTAVY